MNRDAERPTLDARSAAAGEAAAPSGPGAASESRFASQVRRDLTRNYLAHLAHGLFGQTGFRLIQAPTFIPQYVFLLSGSDLIVGVARGLQALGSCLTPIVGATLVEHRRRVLPVGFAVGAGMRAQLLGLALAGLLLPAPWSLIATCGFLGLFGFFLGMQGVIFNFLVSKVIPVEVRGRLNGLRNALAGVTAAGLGGLGGYLIETEALGNGYAATFLLAFGLTAAGLAMLLFLREPPTPRVRERAGVRARLRDLPGLLRADRAFTYYFVARALGMLGMMGVPYYVLYVGSQMELSGTRLGGLTSAFLLAEMVFNLVWGLLADRRGFRAVFLAAVSLWIFSVLLLMTSAGFGSVTLVFIGLGAGIGGFRMASQNLVLEFGARENLPMRIAVANTTSQLMMAVGPVVGGALVGLTSYPTVFRIAIGFQGVALAVMALRVEEPRRRRGAMPE